jgi:hypothetical protein
LQNQFIDGRIVVQNTADGFQLGSPG